MKALFVRSSLIGITFALTMSFANAAKLNLKGRWKSGNSSIQVSSAYHNNGIQTRGTIRKNELNKLLTALQRDIRTNKNLLLAKTFKLHYMIAGFKRNAVPRKYFYFRQLRSDKTGKTLRLYLFGKSKKVKLNRYNYARVTFQNERFNRNGCSGRIRTLAIIRIYRGKSAKLVLQMNLSNMSSQCESILGFALAALQPSPAYQKAAKRFDQLNLIKSSNLKHLKSLSMKSTTWITKQKRSQRKRRHKGLRFRRARR